MFSGNDSDDREVSIAALGRGELDALCSVDVFNEGVDVPSIDRVVMLRPTESSVVFLQQLGRGLRAFPGKRGVTVIDFVGNHRVFLERVRALLTLAGGAETTTLRGFLDSPVGADLPAGCSVELELEAKQLLSKLFTVSGADEVERAYRELRLERGERPTVGELQRMGYLPSRLRERHGSWFEFVRDERDLGDEESQVVTIARGFLRDVEITEMTTCFKIVTLAALVEADALLSGLPLREIALRCHALLRRSPELYADLAEDERIDEIDSEGEPSWIAYWRRNPIAEWTRERPNRRAWLRLDDDRLALALPLDPTLEGPLHGLIRELVDLRLAQYRARRRQTEGLSGGFTCKVTWNQHDPILKLPNRTRAEVPEGEADVRLANGSVWMFRFAKEFCNVARPMGGPRNQLPDLLRRWFGPRAGQPGTAFELRFHRSPDGLWVEPVQATVTELVARRGVIAYPDLRAAAGHALGAAEPPDQELVVLPIGDLDPDLFAVRVAGTSMDGGRDPIHDGDWAVMRVARGTPSGALSDRVVLV